MTTLRITYHLWITFFDLGGTLDRWRELNARAQGWAAEARSGKPGDGPRRGEAHCRRCAPRRLFAFPGSRLMKTLGDRIAADDAATRRPAGASA